MTDPPYNPTTTPVMDSKANKFGHLDIWGFILKFVEVLLSFVAFVLEEVVATCNSCGVLYFFEFVSCTAFLFTLLLFILLASPLHKKVGIGSWDRLDFGYTLLISLLFILASILFLADNSGSDLETGAGVFGLISALVFLANVAYLLLKRRDKIFKTTDKTPSTPPAQVTNPEEEKLRNGENA
ncbi:CKLF-like MARVEL transmembrane domain-containing protein 6 [Sardina pilchardus]|uniref:CKLF-like MARVEL transmembrane domain-containing protein 6 n=1 Tax=Sardina pilchardus TaxID=27697 RepID=UPI002E13E73D